MNKLRHNKKVIEQIVKQAKKVVKAKLTPKDIYTQYFYIGFLQAYVQVLSTLKGYKL